MTARTLLAATVSLISTAAAIAQDPPHVVFVVGEGEYRSEITMPALAERLADAWGWRTTVLHDEELHTGEDNRMPGLEALEDADLAVLYLRFRQWPEEDLQKLTAYVERGGALFGFRTSTHAFRYERDDERVAYNDFGARVLGAPWIRHSGHGASTAAAVTGRGQDDGILDGVPDNFAVRSWTYHVRPDYPPEDARILVRGTPVFPDEREAEEGMINPVAWTWTNASGGRVFMTTMGHPEDFRVAAFRRLVGNGLHWAAGLDSPADTLPDFPSVTHPDDAPDENAPWMRMDYGPFLSTAVAIGGGEAPVHKGIVVQLHTPGGEPTDLHAVFDTDLLAWRCAWTGELALKGIVFDGPHGTFPSIDGDVLFRLPAVPGVLADDAAAARLEDPRGEPWGPVPVEIGRWRGLHLDGNELVFEYEAGKNRQRVLERVWAEPYEDGFAFAREVTSSGANEESTTRVLLLGPREPNEPAPSVATDARAAALQPGGSLALSLPTNGAVRVAIGAPGRANVQIPPPLARDVTDVLAGARLRWGDPLVTRGVLDDPLDDEDAGRRIHLRAGAPGRALTLVRAQGQKLELLSNGTNVERCAAPGAVALRQPADTDGGGLLEAIGADAKLGWWPADAGSGSHERNTFSGEADLRLDGVTWRRGVVGRALDFDGTAAAWLDGLQLDLAENDLTVGAWIHTTSDGTVFAVAPGEGEWAPDGATLFLRGGQLSFDVGWVGVVTGGARIDDGAWHHVAATWRHDEGDVRLFVDGERVARDPELPLDGEEDRLEFVARFGWTNEDFPETSPFSGYMDGLVLLEEALDDGDVEALARQTGEPLIEATLVRWNGGPDAAPTLQVSAAGTDQAELELQLPAVSIATSCEVLTRRGARSTVLAWTAEASAATAAARSFRIDRLTWPDDNPFGSWMRFGAFDFLPDEDGAPESAVISTWSGDLWRVDGLDEDLDELRWTRVATGLNQPFGVVARTTDAGPEVLVLGRDQITRVHDANGDGEADFLENFANANRNSEHFHEPASGLSELADGSLVYFKAARHAKLALHDHHGTVLRVAADGSRTEVLARGFRAPIGLGLLPDGSVLGSDQEGHWTPANRINLIRPSADEPRFYGNGWAARDEVTERVAFDGEPAQPAWELDDPYEPPLCWLHPSVDRSPSAQLHVDHEAWGPLNGKILGLSYGTGEVYLVLRDDVPTESGSISQGGIVKLGIQLPTGLLAGRIHPATGDLYVCGLFGWSSNRTRPGGFYRIRPQADDWPATLNVPHRIRASATGLELTFLQPLDPRTAAQPDRWIVAAWNYRRTPDYGSATYDLSGRANARSELSVRAVTLSADAKTVRPYPEKDDHLE